jgi:hypothetical protein
MNANVTEVVMICTKIYCKSMCFADPAASSAEKYMVFMERINAMANIGGKTDYSDLIADIMRLNIKTITDSLPFPLP